MATTAKRTPARAGEAKRRRSEHDADTLSRINATLAAAQKDLSSMRGTVGSGVGDLRRDVTKLVRDARRDVTKMSKLMRKDLEKLQKDLASPPKPKGKAKAKAARTRGAAPKAKPGARRTARKKAAA